MHHPTDRTEHTTAFVILVVEHWLKREITKWVHHEGSIRRPITPCPALPRSYISLTFHDDDNDIFHSWKFYTQLYIYTYTQSRTVFNDQYILTPFMNNYNDERITCIFLVSGPYVKYLHSAAIAVLAFRIYVSSTSKQQLIYSSSRNVLVLFLFIL